MNKSYVRSLSVTIITGTLNPDIRIFEKSLRSVKSQTSTSVIQHLILDGGSNNGALELAKKFGCDVMSFPRVLESKANRIFSGLSRVKGDLLLLLESDNILTSDHWIRDMTVPFRDPKIFCTFSAYNAYEPDSDTLTKYFALLGSPDPTLSYLGKSDKIRMDQKRYDKGQILKQNPNYYVVRFTKENQPVMGDNGFIIRTSVLRKVVRKNQLFYHTDGYAELLQMGYDTVGVVKNSIIHVSRPNIIEQVKRRVDVKKHFTDEMKGKRKYLVYDPFSDKDKRNLLKYIIFSLTIIQPLYVSIRGYIKIREFAWFLHPLMCFLMVTFYGYSEIRKYLQKN
ncbi:hypothetical protein A2Z00_02355 [Candidatus Gottesmanbacteria bacterium RBG_13_45_10]|uniref:Glycosyltransferase 2-like domain-containing protein n=1 Tax=Candidatus Gottesmanbacteria bacterium RBG_13_45_10 TaxID=1798370 RepID=A0A1F5ZFT7_9BACT|nr:MAG: hypothetical protein A2Z00_02355 [Candidatus Gottesmanbacteria bacterium RBG_13_45_10]